MNLRSVVGYTLLVIAAIASYLATSGEDQDAPPTIDSALVTDGYYMRDAAIQGFGRNGRFLYSLNAREIVEDRDAAVVRLDGVELVYRDDVEVPWKLVATEGELAADGTRLVLMGDVEAQNLAGDVPTSLTTSTLTVDPQNYELSTDARVTLRVGEGSISATGMLAFLNEDRIEFRSNVSGKFLP